MANTMSGPYTETTWTQGVTAANQTHMSNLETQSKVALASINPDIVTSGFVLSGALATRHNSYSSNVLADTPLYYYRLGEASGDTANNLGSVGIPAFNAGGSLATVNVAGLLTGDADTCYTFAAASSTYVAPYFGTPDETGLPTAANAPVTIECWFKFAANPASSQFVLCIGDRGTSGKLYALVLQTTGAIQASNGTVIINSGVLTTGVAHHAVAVFDGANSHLYVDGAQVGTGSAASLTLAYVGSYPVVIGAASSGTGVGSPLSFFSGQIDEVAVYNTALSGARITAHYTAGTTATTQVDIASGKAYLLQSDGTLALCTIGAGQSETTATINSTYHLYLQPDGSWYWSTSNSPAANSLAIATVTTDGSGNATKVTDARPLSIPLFGGASGAIAPAGITLKAIGGQATVGAFGAPVVVAEALRTHVTATGLQTILTFTPPIAGLYRITAYLVQNNGANVKPAIGFTYYDAAYGASAGAFTQYFVGFQTTYQFMDGSHNTLGALAAFPLAPITIYATTELALEVIYNPGGGTPSDYVSAFIERLS